MTFMAERLKNILSFANLAPGASITIPHGLQTSRPRPLAPDVVFIPSAALDLTASDSVSVTFLNQGPVALSGDVLVEAWHTIERAFGDVADEDLPVKPYVVVSVESGGQPPWPPFQHTTQRIYARATGNDTTGTGTLANPYRTFQRAIRDVPLQIPPGTRIVVDITGIGLEVLPPNYALPAIQGPFGLDVSFAFPDADFPWSTVTALEIIATPKLASSVAPADQVITAGNLIGPGITFDPDTNLIEIHTNKSYAADALKGLFLQGATGTNGVIWHNTAGPNSIIYVSSSLTPDEPLTPFFALPVAPLSITEPSAELQTQKGPFDAIKGGFYIAGSGSMGIRGVKIKLAPAFTNPTGFDVEVFGSRTIFFENCDIDTIGIFHSGGEIIFISSIVHGTDTAFGGGALVSQVQINFLASMLSNLVVFGYWAVPTTFKAIGFVADKCVAIGARLDAFTPVGRGPATDLQLRNGVIHSAFADLNYAQIASPANFPAPFFPFSLNPALATPGHGIVFRGGKASVSNVKIFNCAADGIHAEAAFGLMELRSVTGGQGGTVFGDLPDNPNGGAGIVATDGIQVRVSDQDPVATAIVTNVTGVGGDMLVGDLAARTWVNFRTIAPIKNQYDITATAATGATGTGSRLFEKP
jgi:hypothetical protein